MKRAITYFIFLILFSLQTSPAQNKDASVKMYIECGQIKGSPLNVFLANKNLSENNSPRLILFSSARYESSKADTLISPLIFADQSYPLEVDSKTYSKQGTILLFDLAGIDIDDYKSLKRFFPVLEWKEKINDSTFVKKSEMLIDGFFLGHRTGAFLITAIFILAMLFIYWLVAYFKKTQFIGYIAMANGMVSLSLLQMAMWTLAIGGMILIFSLLKLEVPKIPMTLIYLMGLSTVTSIWGHRQSKKLNEGESAPAKTKGKTKALNRLRPQAQPDDSYVTSFKEVLSIRTRDGKYYLSLAKAQLFFWTVLTIIIFIFKSWFDAELWEVPGELVALMGVSQGGFLGHNAQAINEKNGAKN